MKRRYFIILMLILSFAACKSTKEKYIANSGMIYGTYYNIKYLSPNGINLQKKIDTELHRLTMIFSHYEKEATISKINNNIKTKLEPEFLVCFKQAMEISKITNGAFDITTAPLISAWGFSSEERKKITPPIVDSLKQLVGYNKIELKNGQIIKNNPEMTLNMSAIAKGYTCDLISNFLCKKGCNNHMVDIGGEVVAKGKNKKGKSWTIGIRQPSENPLKNELNAIIELPNKAMATSGNYLNFYTIDEKKYAHTIDPSTGYPVQHSLLSATVLAKDCITADAFATAFMVVGKELAVNIASKVPEMEIYFIYTNKNGENETYMSEGFKKYLKK